VIIKRGHESQVIGGAAGNSLFRYYDIIPTSNTSLNATLRFNYFDGELGTLDETTLVYFKSDDSTNWAIQGFTSSNSLDKFCRKKQLSVLFPGGGRFPISTLFCLHILYHSLQRVTGSRVAINLAKLHKNKTLNSLTLKEALMVLTGQLSATCLQQATAQMKAVIYIRITMQLKTHTIVFQNMMPIAGLQYSKYNPLVLHYN
jgi:hypothetical protein